jgi:hypothetical protein
MGSPLSGIIAEIFLQNLEQLRLKHALESKTIIYYTRYVYDIFLIYNPDKITPELILELFLILVMLVRCTLSINKTHLTVNATCT